MERCLECGANLALVGRRHNCRPRSQPTAGEPQATPFISMDEAGAVDVHLNDDEPKLPPKSKPRAARGKTDKVKTKIGSAPELIAKVKKLTAAASEAAKTKFTIRLDPAVVKQIKITSAEREISMERFVELAIKEKLEG